MRRFSNIDNQFVQANELTLAEAFVLEWMLTLPYWANSIVFENEAYYFASKNKACEDLPVVTEKPDTMYRYYKKLQKKNLVKVIKVQGKDYINFRQKCSGWNKKQESDNHPSTVGQSSENHSDVHPTYSNIHIDSNTDIENPTPVKNGKLEFDNLPDPKKETLFRNSAVFDFKIFELQMKKEMELGVDINYYYNSVLDWSNTKSKIFRTSIGWISTARRFMRGDQSKNKLVVIKSTEQEEMRKYLNQ